MYGLQPMLSVTVVLHMLESCENLAQLAIHVPSWMEPTADCLRLSPSSHRPMRLLMSELQETGAGGGPLCREERASK